MVSGVGPMSASAFSGERVTVSGAGFLAGVTVMFGDLPGFVSSVSPTELIVTTPSRAAGTVEIVVTNRTGDQARVAGFEFLDLQVSAMQPAAGLPQQFVIMQGAGFRAGARVLFDGEPATIHSITPRTIRLTAPVLPAGVHDVELINGDGRSVTRPAGFEYLPVTITLSQSTVSPGGVIRVSWTCPLPERFNNDFFPANDILVMSRAGHGQFNWQWERVIASDTGTVDVTAPLELGEYEFRYLLGETVQYATVPFTVRGDQ